MGSGSSFMNNPRRATCSPSSTRDLQLNQLEQVQRDVAALLEHGLNPPAAQPEPAAAEAAPAAAPPSRPRRGGRVRSASRTRSSRRPPDLSSCARTTDPMSAVTGYEELQDRLGYVFRDPALLRARLDAPLGRPRAGRAHADQPAARIPRRRRAAACAHARAV